jgi:hypothetical protein
MVWTKGKGERDLVSLTCDCSGTVRVEPMELGVYRRSLLQRVALGRSNSVQAGRQFSRLATPCPSIDPSSPRQPTANLYNKAVYYPAFFFFHAATVTVAGGVTRVESAFLRSPCSLLSASRAASLSISSAATTASTSASLTSTFFSSASRATAASSGFGLLLRLSRTISRRAVSKCC